MGVTGSYIELHRGTILDLSQGPRASRRENKLNIRGDNSGVIEGLTKVHCESVGDLLAVVEAGTLARTEIANRISETRRSHIIFMIEVTSTDRISGESKTGTLMM